ncbi:3154_t:CDS:10 [Diversispora eburnea]|uniref:3154_t:CDS:1 n=1 Tax=Diversispora eburnea TaxID=1213867 RepID=A0A9N9FJY5_9GLOM|nr:3154_t:CDS:10 [Diversispora eburnea]
MERYQVGSVEGHVYIYKEDDGRDNELPKWYEAPTLKLIYYLLFKNKFHNKNVPQGINTYELIPNPISTGQVSQPAPGIKPKRKQVKNACACKKCDDGRPCQRCIRYELTETCRNSIRKERKKGIKRVTLQLPNFQFQTVAMQPATPNTIIPSNLGQFVMIPATTGTTSYYVLKIYPFPSITTISSSCESNIEKDHSTTTTIDYQTSSPSTFSIGEQMNVFNHPHQPYYHSHHPIDFSRVHHRHDQLPRNAAVATIEQINSQNSLYTTANSTTRFIDSFDKELATKLDEELKYEKDSDSSVPTPEFIKKFLSQNPFKIEDKPGANEVALSRTFGNERIRLLFDVNTSEQPAEPISFPGDDEEEDDEAGKGALGFESLVADGVFLINYVSYYKDSKLAVLFEKYLEERGISTSVALFIPNYVEYKEQKEYVSWLEN